MKKIKMRMATTHVDKHGSKLSFEALQELVDSVKHTYIPIINEHDPRRPPIGRILSAHITKLDDGEYAVDGEGELYDGKEILNRNDDKREFTLESRAHNEFQLYFDEYFLNKADGAVITELNDLLKATNSPKLEVKKACEPLCIFTIAGSFVIAAFFSGIFTEMGKDAYALLKKKVATLMSEKQKQLNVECLLRLDFILEQDARMINIEILMTNASADGIDDVLDTKLVMAVTIAEQLLRSNTDVKKIVFEYYEKQLLIRYGMRKDAVPVEISTDSIAAAQDATIDSKTT